jgi:hypothetical protein
MTQKFSSITKIKIRIKCVRRSNGTCFSVYSLVTFTTHVGGAHHHRRISTSISIQHVPYIPIHKIVWHTLLRFSKIHHFSISLSLSYSICTKTCPNKLCRGFTHSVFGSSDNMCVRQTIDNILLWRLRRQECILNNNCTFCQWRCCLTSFVRMKFMTFFLWNRRY